MISYEPLHKSLKKLGRTLNEMRKDNTLNSRTIARLYKNKSVHLSTIEKICLWYGLPIEKVVEIKPDESDNARS